MFYIIKRIECCLQASATSFSDCCCHQGGKKLVTVVFFYQIAKLYRDNFNLEYELTLLIYNFTHFYFSGQLFIQIFYIMKKYFHCIFYLYIPCSHVWLFKKNDKNCSVFCLYLEYKICDPIKSGVNRNMG